MTRSAPLTLLFLLALAAPVWAQKEGKKTTELGINITNIVTGLFDSDELLGANDPYLLSIKKGHHNKYFRMAFNLAAGRDVEDLNDGSSTFTRTTNDVAVFTRFGFEHRLQLGKRSTLHWGGDGVLNWSNIKTETDNASFEDFSIKDRTFGIGLGPVLGFQFAVHPRIILSTETALYFMVNLNKTEQSFGSFPGVDQTATTYDLSPRLPGALYVHFLL